MVVAIVTIATFFLGAVVRVIWEKRNEGASITPGPDESHEWSNAIK